MPDDRPEPGWVLSVADAPAALAGGMEIRNEMQRIAVESSAYGYRRITAELQKRGFAVNHKRVLRMTREDNLLVLRHRKFVVTTDSRHNLPIYPNLASQIT